MKQILTIACKLQGTPEQFSKIDNTLLVFADACNYINQAVDPKYAGKARIQALTYLLSKFATITPSSEIFCQRTPVKASTAADVGNFGNDCLPGRVDFKPG